MFVSILLESGSLDSGKNMIDILARYGLKKIQKSCWESMNIKEADLAALKKDLDSVTDYYDVIRIYQFPVNGMFVITEMNQKKWRRAQFAASNPQQKNKTIKPNSKK